MKPASAIQPGPQPPNHRPPILVLGGFTDDRADHDWAPEYRRGPIRPGVAGDVEGDHFESAIFFVDRDEARVALGPHRDLEAHGPTEGALLVVREDAFDQRVAGSEEVDEFVLDGFFTIERADVAGAGGNPRQAVDERTAAELD